MPAKKKTTTTKTEEVEPDPAFDAKSAEVADVAQQGEDIDRLGKLEDKLAQTSDPASTSLRS